MNVGCKVIGVNGLQNVYHKLAIHIRVKIIASLYIHHIHQEILPYVNGTIKG
jgi:hypothetical protein